MATTIQDHKTTDTTTPTPAPRRSRKTYTALGWVAAIAATAATILMVGAVLAGGDDDRAPGVVDRAEAAPMRIDAKDHPRYGSVTQRDANVPEAAPRIDAKDHPRYGSVTRAGARIDARADGCFVYPHGIVRC